MLQDMLPVIVQFIMHGLDDVSSFEELASDRGREVQALCYHEEPDHFDFDTNNIKFGSAPSSTEMLTYLPTENEIGT